MKELEEKIRKYGVVVSEGVLKVDSFLNHMVDVAFLDSMAQNVVDHFGQDCGVTKVVTLEASGIPFAHAIARLFGCNLLYAKKGTITTMSDNVYRTRVRSFTRGGDVDVTVEKSYLTEDDQVIIADDFLSYGYAADALIDIVGQSGAMLLGCAFAIEKKYIGAGDKLRERGIKVYSLAEVRGLKYGGVTF